MPKPYAAIGAARVLPFQPPAIRGVGTFGGFQFVVEDRSGTRSLDELSNAVNALVAKASQSPELRGVYTTFTAATPLLNVDVDRQKAKALGVPVDQVFSTLQLFMGSQYVNDFNYASRTYRVYLQADSQFRDEPRDIGAFYVRSEPGEMIPLESLVNVSQTTSAQTVRHYNLFRSAEISGQPAPGVSSGEALLAMERLAAEGLPRRHGHGDGQGSAWNRKRAAGQNAGEYFASSLVVFTC